MESPLSTFADIQSVVSSFLLKPLHKAIVFALLFSTMQPAIAGGWFSKSWSSNTTNSSQSIVPVSSSKTTSSSDSNNSRVHASDDSKNLEQAFKDINNKLKKHIEDAKDQIATITPSSSSSTTTPPSLWIWPYSVKEFASTGGLAFASWGIMKQLGKYMPERILYAWSAYTFLRLICDRAGNRGIEWVKNEVEKRFENLANLPEAYLGEASELLKLIKLKLSEMATDQEKTLEMKEKNQKLIKKQALEKKRYEEIEKILKEKEEELKREKAVKEELEKKHREASSKLTLSEEESNRQRELERKAFEEKEQKLIEERELEKKRYEEIEKILEEELKRQKAAKEEIENELKREKTLNEKQKKKHEEILNRTTSLQKQEMPNAPKDLKKEPIQKENTDDLFLRAKNAYEQKNFDEALKLFTQASKLGNAEASLQLAFMHLEKSNHDDAFTYFKKAAQQGNTVAAYNIGVKYLKNEQRDKAKKWFKSAADKNDPIAQFAYAKTVIEENEENPDNNALKYLQKAAENNHSQAQYAYGVALYEGKWSLTKDQKKGIEYIRSSAHKGIGSASQYLNKNKIPLDNPAPVTEKNNFSPEPASKPATPLLSEIKQGKTLKPTPTTPKNSPKNTDTDLQNILSNALDKIFMNTRKSDTSSDSDSDNFN